MPPVSQRVRVKRAELIDSVGKGVFITLGTGGANTITMTSDFPQEGEEVAYVCEAKIGLAPCPQFTQCTEFTTHCECQLTTTTEVSAKPTETNTNNVSSAQITETNFSAQFTETKNSVQPTENKPTVNEAIDKIKQHSRNLAKKQFTFFNNQFDVHWITVDLENFENTIKETINIINE